MKNSVKMSEKLKNGYENPYLFQNRYIHLQLFSYSFSRQGVISKYTRLYAPLFAWYYRSFLSS